MKFLSVAAVAVALIATVAVARTVHTHAVPADQPQLSSGKVVGTAPAQKMPSLRNGIIVCGMAIDADCEKIEAPM